MGFEYISMYANHRKNATALCDVFADVLARGAVVGLGELVNRALCVIRCVPQELCEDIRAQLGEFAALAEVVCLLVDARDAVGDEEVDVRLEDAEVRERHDAVRVVDDIVPDVQAVADFRPVADVIDKRLVERAGFQRMRETAF